MEKKKRDAGLFDIESSPSVKKQKVNAVDSTTKTKPIRRAGARRPVKKKTTKPKGIVKENNIVVGVDFGTTFSGVSFTRTANPEPKDVRVVKEWPGTPGEFEKVPSRVCFKSGEVIWGYQVQPDDESYCGMKLHLDSDTANSAYDSEALSKQVKKGLLELPPDMTAEEVIQHYLKQLYKHTMYRLGKAYSKAVVDVNKIEFFLTIPATWSAGAKHATERAARRAGFGSRENDILSVIREPEAAAIASLTLAIEENPELYKKGMYVLVADLGGGTVDFQCSKIESLSPLRISDAVMGRSAKCRSISIDSKFCVWLEQVFGQTYSNLPASKTGIGSDFMNIFEDRKKAFDRENLTKTVSISMPALGHALRDSGRQPEEYDFDEFFVKLPKQNLKDMFDPTIEKTLALVEQQRLALGRDRKKRIQVICLCGGLGNSPYVSERFQQYVDEKFGSKCSLVTDARAWSSVVRGAAIRGLQGAVVTSRVANHHIGIGVHQSFRSGVDNDQDGFTDALGNKRAGGYVDWLLPKHQRFRDNKEYDTNVFELVNPAWDDDKKQFTWILYSCAEDVAPNRSDAACVEKVAEIDLDLSEAYPKSKTKVKGKIKSGTEIAKFRVVMKMGDETGKMAVLARHNRKVIATGEVDYMKIGKDSEDEEIEAEVQSETETETETEYQDQSLFFSEALEVDETVDLEGEEE